MAPNFFLTKGGVQQEGCAWLGRREHVDAIDERELVASDEAGLGDEICGGDLFRAETDVRNGDSAGFLRVVDEISLRVIEIGRASCRERVHILDRAGG